MMNASEKIAYLKGMLNGMDFDFESKQGKVLKAMLEIFDDLAQDTGDLKDNYLEMTREIDAISDDLQDVEMVVFDDDPDFADSEPVYEQGEEVPADDEDPEGPSEPTEAAPAEPPEGAEEEPEEAAPEEEPELFEVTCPFCSKSLTIDEDTLEIGSIQCPNCGEMLELELEDEDSGEN